MSQAISNDKIGEKIVMHTLPYIFFLTAAQVICKAYHRCVMNSLRTSKFIMLTAHQKMSHISADVQRMRRVWRSLAEEPNNSI